ncbi:MAG: chemotaxis protein CheW [Myxococcota bacterium]
MTDELLASDEASSTGSFAAEQTHDVLAFIIADEAYSFPLESIREILKHKPITPVPRAPQGVLGILSVRGTVTTIVDLRAMLRVHAQPATRHSRVLLVDQGDEIIGVLVDRVLQVVRLAPDEVEGTAMVSGDLSDYVAGIGRPRSGRGREAVDLLILLDPTAILRRSHGA